MNDTRGIAGRFLSLLEEGIIMINPDCFHTTGKLTKFTEFVCDAQIAAYREQMETIKIPMKEVANAPE